jgi:DNA-binding transcriptional LysR family regulator
MEFHQIRYFLALARTLNFTRAAEACNVTQPALTRAIQKLEEELGGPLLHRERNLTQLTELGRATLPYLEKIYVAAEATKAHAASLLKQETATIRVGLLPSVSARTIVQPLSEVARRIPGLEVQMMQARQGDLIQQLNEDALDVALLADDGELPERLNRWPLFRERYDLVCHADHRLAGLAAITLAELAAEVFVGRQMCPYENCLRKAATDTGLKLRFVHSCATEDQIARLVAANLGIALVPEHLGVPAPLVRLPLPSPGVERAIVVATMHGRRHTSAVEHFVRLNRVHPFAPGAKSASKPVEHSIAG